MKTFLILLGFVSAFGWAEDSNYHIKTIESGAYEMTIKGTSYILDVSQKKRGELVLEWRDKIPSVAKSHRSMPRKFDLDSKYDSYDEKFIVRNRKRFSFSHTWGLSGGGQITRSSGNNYHELHVKWHDRDEKTIHVRASLVGQGWYTKSGFAFQARCWYRRDTADFYLKKIEDE